MVNFTENLPSVYRIKAGKKVTKVFLKYLQSSSSVQKKLLYFHLELHFLVLRYHLVKLLTLERLNPENFHHNEYSNV